MSQKRSELKHVYVEKEVWRRIHELKYRWGMETFSDVIKELLRRLELW